MEKNKLNGFSKFIALFIISALVISVVIFTASGDGAVVLPDSGNISIKDQSNSTGTNPPYLSDGSDNLDAPGDDDASTESPTVFINKITGLEITENEYNARAYGIVIDPNLSVYGLSFADFAVEFPMETGASRMLFFSTSDEVLWKVGALMPTRKYINNISKYFGGIIVANGIDDSVEYRTNYDGAFLDVSKHTDCTYTENGKSLYTSENLLEIALNRTHYVNNDNTYTSSPYIISVDGVTDGIKCANSVIIPYSDKNTTHLIYDGSIGKYVYTKNSEQKIDMLSGARVEYDNAFILFANSTTYENSNTSELVIDTEGGGVGYYFSGGKMNELRWSSNDGVMTFKNLMGETLNVNQGTSYISFYKASECGNITMN